MRTFPRRWLDLGLAVRLLLPLLLLPGFARAAGQALGPAAGQVDGLSSELVSAALDLPVHLTAPQGDSRLFVVEQRGRVQILAAGELLEAPFLDISDLVPVLIGSFDERGLLGLAFHPSYPSESCFFVNYTAGVGGATIIARYRVSEDPDVADASSGEILLVIDQPARNHNGGHLAFGPEPQPTLYIGMGDGGGSGDPDNRAQNDAMLLGKLLRYRVGCTGGLEIPPDNPFIDEADPEDEVQDAIWAKGLRNPYRFSFDREQGDLYIGDVGQRTVEEIDVEPFGSDGGLNYGWRIEEGSLCFDDPLPPATGCGDASLTRPVFEYGHAEGRCSVTGGYVYRGAIRSICGLYFFADYCAARIWSFRWDTQGGVSELSERTGELSPQGEIQWISGFGEDGSGELYVLALRAGEVFRVVPEPGSRELAASALCLMAIMAHTRRRRGRCRLSTSPRHH